MPLSYDDLANWYTQHLLNSTPRELTFKPNPNLGEGQASQREWDYREEILSLLQRLYRAIKKVEQTSLSDEEKARKRDIMINDFIREGKVLVKEHIQKVFKEQNQMAIDKLKELDITAKKPTIPSDAQAALIEWQMFTVEKIGETLRLDLLNNQYKKKYFSVAYGQ